MKDCMEWILSHPIFNSGEDSTEATSETSDSPSGGDAKFNTFVGSVGKRKIFYKNAGLYELLEMSIMCDIDSNKMETILVRSGLGATTKIKFADSNASDFSANVTFNQTSTRYNFVNSTYMGSDNSSGRTSAFCTLMIAQTVNELPTYESNDSQMLAHVSYPVIGSSRYPANYAENTFTTNNSSYYSNHTLISQTNFNICQVMVPIQNNTVVNADNISNYSNYGLVVGAGGVINLDPDLFLNYFNNTLKPELELIYRNAYTHFPDIGAEFSDDDIIYVNPFPEIEPDTTNSGGVPALWNGETYILETSSFNVDYPEAVQSPYDILKQSANISPSLIQSAGGMITEAFSIIPSDFLSFYCFAMLLSIVLWFVFRK